MGDDYTCTGVIVKIPRSNVLLGLPLFTSGFKILTVSNKINFIFRKTIQFHVFVLQEHIPEKKKGLIASPESSLPLTVLYNKTKIQHSYSNFTLHRTGREY